MDEEVEGLRRALRKDPGDLAAAMRLASALEKAGRFDEAWELLEKHDHAEGLAAFASANPRALLARLQRLDYRRTRLLTERLVALGQGRNPALIALACEGSDALVRGYAAKAVARANPDLGTEDWEPDSLRTIGVPFDAVRPAGKRELIAASDRRKRALAQRIIERSGTAQAVALLPWLVPLLATRDPALVTQALEAVRRLTRRDGPPFDLDLIATLLRDDEGEAA